MIFNIFLISKTKAIIKVSSNCVVVSMTCSFCCYQGKGYWLLYQLLFWCPVTDCVEFAWQRAGHACVRCCARGSSRFSIISWLGKPANFRGQGYCSILQRSRDKLRAKVFSGQRPSSRSDHRLASFLSVFLHK